MLRVHALSPAPTHRNISVASFPVSFILYLEAMTRIPFILNAVIRNRPYQLQVPISPWADIYIQFSFPGIDMNTPCTSASEISVFHRNKIGVHVYTHTLFAIRYNCNETEPLQFFLCSIERFIFLYTLSYRVG